MNVQTRSSKHSWRLSPLALGLALLLGAAACSDAASDRAAEEADTDAESPLPSRSGDDEAANAVATDDAVATGDGAQDRTGDRAEEAGAAADDAVGAPTSQGFFPEPEGDILDDNTFQGYGIRTFIETGVDSRSTFALDVDTASYSIGRRWLTEGVLPPQESVRVEEYVNSFRYDYPAPSDGLTIVAQGGPSPFDSGNVILQLGVQAEVVAEGDRPPASLVFVIDTSGSMERQNRLDLVKTSLIELVGELGSDDTVAIVTYSNGADVLLRPTSARFDGDIIDAIDGLRPDGSTNLEAGLEAGYDLANEAFRSGGINRVILASDGVANVGLTDPDGLVDLIRNDADRGIQLVTVGVGMGNFNDVVMETLADDGDGFYAYVDTPAEAAELFSDDLVSTLLTVAIDGKIQVEFEPEVVESYRLLGFENRAVLDDDFRNDTVDAGELGAAHQVTAIYELKLVDGPGATGRLGMASLRWEDPQEGTVRETRLEMTTAIIEDRWLDTSDDFRLAVTVAAFAEILRGSPYAEGVTLAEVADEAEAIDDLEGPVEELVDLVRRADRLW